METECNKLALDFQPLGGRQITARFDGGTITSDAGGLLLREVEAASGLLSGLATCFDDHRDRQAARSHRRPYVRPQRAEAAS